MAHLGQLLITKKHATLKSTIASLKEQLAMAEQELADLDHDDVSLAKQLKELQSSAVHSQDRFQALLAESPTNLATKAKVESSLNIVVTAWNTFKADVAKAL